MEKFELRKYQRDAVDAGLECLLNNKKGIAVLPCGAGKSLIAAKVAEELDKPIVILQPSKELLLQNYSKFVSFGGVASIYCASLKDKTIDKEDYTVMPDGTLKKCREISKVTFATIGSIKKETALLKRAGLKYLCLDEVHIAMKHKTGSKDTQLRTFIKDLKIKSVLGLTATPVHLVNTQDGAKLNMMNRTYATMFRQIIHVTQISELVENNYWSPLIYENQLTQTSMLELNTTGSDYTELSQQLFYQENSLHSRILERIKELQKEGRKRILVFMPSVQEAQDLYEENTDDFAIVHSKMTMKKRNYMISEFREGKRPVAVNCNILATGFDEPEIDAVILARPTNSMAIYYQQCIDKKTEILTKRGFLKWDEVTEEDVAYGYDKDTGEIKENPIKSIVDRKQYNFENIISFSNIRTNFRVSSEHDMIFKSSRTKTYKKDKAKSMLDMKGGINIPVSGFQKAKGLPLNKFQLELLGWVLSDGYVSKGGDITISQSSESPYIKDIENCITNCGYDLKFDIIKREYKEYAVGHNYRINRSKCKDFVKYCDKNISPLLEDITREQLKIVMESIIKADGINKKVSDYNVKSHRICVGNSLTYINKLQSLLLRRGFYCNIVCQKQVNKDERFGKIGRVSYVYYLTFKDTRHVYIPGKNVKNGSISGKKPYKRNRIKVDKENKNNELWCLETEMGTIITRREGKPTIMGNCGRGVRIHPKKEDCKIVDFSGSLDLFGRLEDIKFEDLEYYGWAMTSGNKKVVTGFPMDNLPTIEKVINRAKEKHYNIDGEDKTMKMSFGKHKGKTLHRIHVEDRGYLKWIVSPEFKPFNKLAKKLKKEAEIELQKFIL